MKQLQKFPIVTERSSVKENEMLKKSLKTSENFGANKRKNSFNNVEGIDAKKRKPNKETKTTNKFNTNNLNSTEKPDWKKFKKDRKELKQKRKEVKNYYTIAVQAKIVYEKFKTRTTKNKTELIEKLFDLVQEGETLQRFVMAHDTARIVQSMVKYGSSKIREEIAKKLYLSIPQMAISKYGHFVVWCLTQYCPLRVKSKITDCLMGHIVKLLNKSFSSKIICHIYLNVANKQQKCYMRQEIYDDIHKTIKNDEVHELSDTFNNIIARKSSIMSNIKLKLEHFGNKNLLDNSLIHAVIKEYIEQCDKEQLDEFVPIMTTGIAQLLTTQDGRNAAITVFNKCETKHRRAIVKSMKEHLIQICLHVQGHIFVIAVINCLDDTKAIKKLIFDNIYPNLQTLMKNKYGRHIIEWFVAPANTKSFHPSAIEAIDRGLTYSKKPKEQRRLEILEQIESQLANSIVKEPDFFLHNRHIALTTSIIINNLTGENYLNAAKALAVLITQTNWMVSTADEFDECENKNKIIEDIIIEAKKNKQNEKIKINDEEKKTDDENDILVKNERIMSTTSIESQTIRGIEEVGIHKAIKSILKNDKIRLQQKLVDSNTDTFGKFLIEELSADTIKMWLTINRALFILVNIVDNDCDHFSAKKMVKELLEPFWNEIDDINIAGGKILKIKLN